MFWRKSNKNSAEKPLGVQLSIDLNAMSLDNLAQNSVLPSIERMTDVWLRYNCTRISFGLAALNSANRNVLFVSGADGTLHRDIDIEVSLPFPVGPRKAESVFVTPTENFIFLSFEEVAIMAFPTIYIAKLLSGEPLASYQNLEKDTFGVTSEIVINVTSAQGEYKLPVISKLASKWFKYENTVVKVMATPIAANSEFPVKLGMSTE